MIRVRPQVEAEIQEAMAWYGERAPGLDRIFHRTVLDVLFRLEVVVLACLHERRSPERWPGSV